MSRLTVYTLANCDTCRCAVKWLRSHSLDFEEKPIRETPPSLAELRTMLTAYAGDCRRLFNTAGRDHRELGLAGKLPGMTEDDALGLLARNGNLVKRPFLIGAGVALVGFDEKTWTSTLVKS